MSRFIAPRSFFFLVAFVFVLCQTAKTTEDTPSIAEKTAGMVRFDGFVPFYWDKNEGKVWLEIERLNEEFLYVVSLPAGLGSNDIGLDRGQLGGSHVVSFLRSGPKILLVEPNYDYRADSENAAEQRAVRDAFATSVLAGFSIGAEEDGVLLVDATAFLLSDAHGVVGALARSDQGTYSLDLSRSVFFPPMMKNFPLNTEIEAMLTFSGKNPGRWVRSVTPTPQSITVRQRHSFVKLPDDAYVPRRFDPRGGFFGIQYADYATSIGQPLVQRFIARHRLQKKDPSSAIGQSIEPIVYYVDPGTPEPIRSALVEGAQWWDQAFQAAGFVDAFRVEVLPPNADPMDVRYNVIQWVHRSTRGWSYGATVTDPRTGEIIKGHVSLGSLRARQDYLIAEGLLAPYGKRGDVDPRMQNMALARLRQLSAHEVGHTLGLSHNYIASSKNRASVMDYPHPYAQLTKDGSIDLSDAYDTDIAEWDKVAITFGYREYPKNVNADEMSRDVLMAAMKNGSIFLTDQDARPPGSAHPTTHLWDNGSSAVDELDRIMKVREAALRRFSENVIPVGRPMAMLEEALVPLYLGHRYQVEAASKVIAGASYTFALRGDGQPMPETVPAPEQRRALTALLNTLSPEVLALPKPIASLIPPRPYGYDRHRELFASGTLPLFDQLAPAEAAAHHTLSLLFNSERLNRLVQQHASDRDLPGLDEVLRMILEKTWSGDQKSGMAEEVQRVVQAASLEHVLALTVERSVSTQVRAIAVMRVRALRSQVADLLGKKPNAEQRAHLEYSIDRIDRCLAEPGNWKPSLNADPPPGQPIGSFGDGWSTCTW